MHHNASQSTAITFLLTFGIRNIRKSNRSSQATATAKRKTQQIFLTRSVSCGTLRDITLTIRSTARHIVTVFCWRRSIMRRVFLVPGFCTMIFFRPATSSTITLLSPDSGPSHSVAVEGDRVPAETTVVISVSLSLSLSVSETSVVISVSLSLSLSVSETSVVISVSLSLSLT